MVKGVSRQVILVRPKDGTLFEQAIFILRDDAPPEGITDEMLLKEAKLAAATPLRKHLAGTGPVWACGGAACTALIWLLSILL